MKDSAPPNPVVAPTGPSRSVEEERHAVVALAARLGAAGARPVVQPTAIAPSPGATLAAHAASAGLGAALGWIWPVAGLALIAATGWSAWRVANGAMGWVTQIGGVVLAAPQPVTQPRLKAPLDGPLGKGRQGAVTTSKSGFCKMLRGCGHWDQRFPAPKSSNR